MLIRIKKIVNDCFLHKNKIKNAPKLLQYVTKVTQLAVTISNNVTINIENSNFLLAHLTNVEGHPS